MLWSLHRHGWKTATSLRRRRGMRPRGGDASVQIIMFSYFSVDVVHRAVSLQTKWYFTVVIFAKSSFGRDQQMFLSLVVGYLTNVGYLKGRGLTSSRWMSRSRWNVKLCGFSDFGPVLLKILLTQKGEADLKVVVGGGASEVKDYRSTWDSTHSLTDWLY